MPRKASERRNDAVPVVGTDGELLWRAFVFQTTWIVSRKFHFQAFSYVDANGKGTVLREKAAKFVPATAFVVADHLSQLIITDGIPREGTSPQEDAHRTLAFNQAVWRLHATTFAPYYDWAQHQRFEAFPKADEANWKQLPIYEERTSLPALLDLCAYFCLWTEAANVKHMPEALWFLFWAMRHSPHFNQLYASINAHSANGAPIMFPDLWVRGQGTQIEPSDWYYTLLHLRELRVAVRNKVLTAERFEDIEALVQQDPDPHFRQRPANLRLQNGRTIPVTHLDAATAADARSVQSDRFHPLRHFLTTARCAALGERPNSSINTVVLRDLVFIGDGGLFLERIITPIFQALAFELATKGGNGCEPALRITYDDANESFVLPSNVAEILRHLHCQGRPDEVFLKLWQADHVQQIGVELAPPASFYHDMRAVYGGTDQAPSSGVFKKTFQERRTWLQLFRAYFRVIAFHVLWFHILLGLSFADNNDFEFEGRWWVPLSSAVLTHALLSLAYFWSGLFIKSHIPAPPAASHDIRRRVQSGNVVRYVTWLCCLCCCGVWWRERDLTAHEKPLSKRLWTVPKVNRKSKLFKQAVMMFVFVALFAALLFVFVAQFSWFPWPEDQDQPVADQLRIGEQSPGAFFRDVWPAVAAIYGVVVLVLGAVIVQRDGYVITAASLRAGFARLVGKCVGSGGKGSDTLAGGAFVSKVPPRYGYGQLLRNMLFWAIVLALKFALDYFLIIRALPDPIRGLLNASWLETCDADLEIGNTGIPCVENMVLVVALCFPIFLVTVFDTGILYQIGVFLYGSINGLFVQKLGQVVTWNDLIKTFERGVNSFGRRMLSVRALERWQDPRHVRHYYESDDAKRGATAGESGVPRDEGTTAPLDADNDWRSQEYARWTPFAHVWDTIITELRISDLISNEESSNLRFKSVHFLKDRPYELKPLILPICFFAGKVQQALDNGSVDTVGLGVLADAVNLFLVLLHKIGLINDAMFANCRKRGPDTGISLLNQPQNHYHTDVRTKMIKALSAFVSALVDLIPKGSGAASNVQKTQQAAVDQFVDLMRNLEIELSYCKTRWGVAHPAADQLSNVGEILRGGTAGLTVRTEEGDAGEPAYAVRPGSLFQKALGKLSTQAPHMEQLDLEERAEIQSLRNITQALKAAISLTDQQSEPRNDEAKRVLKFYMSSLLNANMPRPLDYALMRSLTTLVPHYSEDVIYPLDGNEVKARTGKDATAGKITSLVHSVPGMEISTLDFLRIQFQDEWQNFVERLIENWRGALSDASGHPIDLAKIDPAAITVHDFVLSNEHGLFSREEDARMELMMWASDRGQLLARTTRGMMMYQQALELFEPLESADPRAKLNPSFYEGKFRHIVAAQVYGEKAADGKGENRWIAKSIDLLMRRYPTFRVAYMDKVKDHPIAGAHGVTHSVLLRWREGPDGEEGGPEEVYRVRLPWQTEDKRGVVLGEGKPENQNAAMIYCFGECVQTVDMNQENRLAEAYKMRNLLSEFEPNRERVMGMSNVSAGVFRDDVAANAAREPIVALVGFREWIFSGKAGALGAFAAGAEFAFGTIVQRTMAEPGGARFHYGHPDVWNKLFTMTRGGVSKATRAFHISEDVFGGYNAIFRGAIVKYKEYISVGKGRDVGFEQINGFEAKVSGGNGEQAISRDVYRLGSRLGWFRLMSWYHSGIGFFVNSTLTMASVYLAVWLVFVFALAGALTVRSGDADTRINDSQLINSVNTVQIFQLGLLSVIPYWAELCLETGFLNGSVDILSQMVSGSLLFFIFRQQTSAFYFTQIAYYGGAKYIATGRGFALTHTPYVSTFSNFGRSHIYFGFQLGMLAVMLAFVGVRDYFPSTWGTWLVSISLTFAPLWFNPHTFLPDVAWADFKAWRNWMLGSQDPHTGESWIRWHRGQLEKPRNVGGKQTDHVYNRLGGVLMQFFNVVIFIALAERIVRPRCLEVGVDGGCERAESRRPKVLGAVLFELAVAFVIAMLIVQRIARSWGAQLRRFVSIAAFVLFAVMLVLYLRVFGDTASSGFVDIVLLGFANFTLGIIIVQLTLFIAPYNELGLAIVNAGYYAADTVIGLVTFAFVFLLSIVPLVDSIQALLLFNKDVLQASRAGRQLSDFRTRTGSAGAAAIFGAPAAQRTTPTSPAAAEAPAASALPAGAVSPIPAPAADPKSVLPPRRFTDDTMTYGHNLAASVMGGVRGAFGGGHHAGSSSRRRRPFVADLTGEPPVSTWPPGRSAQPPPAPASPARHGGDRRASGAQPQPSVQAGRRQHRPGDI